MFRLERGATGFRSAADPEPPSTPVRTFRAACHAAARAASGTVDHITERTYPGTFHTAAITTRTGRLEIRCHFIHPWLAIPDAPPWAAAFTEHGFTVLDRDVLDLPLSSADTTALAPAEWDQINYWQPATVGDTAFNDWD